tara:strand:- start:224 stop:493 length:270 start_codon:yes stop_codon:yes gene_type:complete
MAKEKIVELKTKVEKISDEHLNELQGIINTINQTQIQIGKLEGQKHNLLHDLAITQNKVSVMQDTLNKEYGTDDVNIVDGTINWKEDEK